MLARVVAGVFAVAAVAAALASLGSEHSTEVVAAGAVEHERARESQDSPSRRVVQGEVLAVHDEGRRLEVAISLQWVPHIARVAERASFSTNGRTRVNPSDGGRASLGPGDPVQLVAVAEGDKRWRAIEITKLDLD